MKKLWLLLILPVVLLMWWGLGRGGSAPEVHFTAVKRLTIDSTVSTNGKVEPAASGAARAETAGVVKSISIHKGQTVQTGQVLITLDTAAAQSELAAALAREQEARAEDQTIRQGGKPGTLASVNDSIAAAQAAVDVAQHNYDALQRLAQQQAATKLQVQQASDALTRAKLQLSAAENQRKTLVTSSDQTVAQAKLHDAEAAVSLAQHRLAMSAVQAPIGGTVYQFDLKIGAYLQPGDLVAMIGNLDQVKVTVYVDEPDLGRVGEGMPVKITWDARPGQQWWGRVDKMPTEVVALGTRTVGEVSTIIDNPNHDLIPGVSVNATIVSKHVKDTPAIPKAAFRTLNGSSGVFKLDGKELKWTPIRAGVSDINNVEVLSGLNEGDEVADRVIEPSDAEIRNGMRVRPVVK